MFRTLHRAVRLGLAAVAAGGISILGAGLRAEPPKPAQPPKPAPTGLTVVKPVGPKPTLPDFPPPLPEPGRQPRLPMPQKPDLPARPGEGQPVTPATGWPAAAEGHFRVQVTGFQCDHQTRDDILENDGAGDEVILRCWTRVLDRGTVLSNQAFGVSGIFAADDHHGDAGAFFIRAGTANLDHGGIASGNRVPTAGGRVRGLPLTVFDGTLVDGRSVAVISPTVWEWDDFCGDRPGAPAAGTALPARFWSTDSGNENDRLSAFERAMGSLRATDRTSRLAASHVGDAAATPAVRRGFDLDLPTVRGDMGGNRGIGSIDTGDGIVFQPKAMVLNYAIADRLARVGRLIPVRYVDSEGLDGDYTVWLSVERLP